MYLDKLKSSSIPCSTFYLTMRPLHLRGAGNDRDLHLQRPLVIPSRISSVIIPPWSLGYPIVTWPSPFCSERDEGRRQGDQRAQHSKCCPELSRVLCLLTLTNPDVAVELSLAVHSSPLLLF